MLSIISIALLTCISNCFNLLLDICFFERCAVGKDSEI